MKNECGKTRKSYEPYEIWQAGMWTWFVLKKWQADDNKPLARWFCRVVTPMTGKAGDWGDTYAKDVKEVATKVTDPAVFAQICADHRLASEK